MLFGPAPSTFLRAHINKTNTILNNSIDLVSTIVHGVIEVVEGGRLSRGLQAIQFYYSSTAAYSGVLDSPAEC